MAQTEIGWLVSLSLLAENRAETKEQSLLSSALSSASCRRSGCSSAEPYPPHECIHFTISRKELFPSVTFSFDRTMPLR